MSEATAFVESMRDLGGPMTPEEKRVVFRSKELLNDVLDSGHGFDVAAHTILAAMRRSVEVPHDAFGLCRSFDFGLSIDRIVEQSQSASTGIPDHELTEAEAKFIHDALGAIRFALDNGLGFLALAAALCHDLREICDAGGLEKALFVPKVSGWAEMSEDQVGSSEVD